MFNNFMKGDTQRFRHMFEGPYGDVLDKVASLFATRFKMHTGESGDYECRVKFTIQNGSTTYSFNLEEICDVFALHYPTDKDDAHMVKVIFKDFVRCFMVTIIESQI